MYVRCCKTQELNFSVQFTALSDLGSRHRMFERTSETDQQEVKGRDIFRPLSLGPPLQLKNNWTNI